MTRNIVTTGRTDVDDYFRLSGIRSIKRLTHTPFLIFVDKGEIIEVELVERADRLLNYPDDTKVMAQWEGEWRSDFFQFTIGQFRAYIVAHPPTGGQFV